MVIIVGILDMIIGVLGFTHQFLLGINLITMVAFIQTITDIRSMVIPIMGQILTTVFTEVVGI